MAMTLHLIGETICLDTPSSSVLDYLLLPLTSRTMDKGNTLSSRRFDCIQPSHQDLKPSTSVGGHYNHRLRVYTPVPNLFRSDQPFFFFVVILFSLSLTPSDDRHKAILSVANQVNFLGGGGGGG